MDKERAMTAIKRARRKRMVIKGIAAAVIVGSWTAATIGIVESDRQK